MYYICKRYDVCAVLERRPELLHLYDSIFIPKAVNVIDEFVGNSSTTGGKGKFNEYICPSVEVTNIGSVGVTISGLVSE